MSSATIKDVAKRAGVGLGTVSRVLNNHPRVSADTRERVLQAIGDLNFRPNATARRLPRKTALRHIGVLSHPFVKNYHSIAERVRGIQTALMSYGRDLEIVLYSVSSPEHYDAQITNIVQHSDVLGLLIIDFDLREEQMNALRAANIPFVGINNLRDRAWACVGTDDQQGAYLATQHLIQLGHKRIAYVGDNLFDPHEFPTSQARYSGYAQALQEAGIHLNNRYVKLGNHSYEAAHRLTYELFDLAQPPTAIFAMSDLQAMGCIATINSLNMQVPHDVSIVGYDDTELSGYTRLTTVRQHLERGGQVATSYLLSLIRGETLLGLPKMPSVEVIVRQTTTNPRKV
jgi:DNA-binding LacI/PurR family transcriptional regulator